MNKMSSPTSHFLRTSCALVLATFVMSHKTMIALLALDCAGETEDSLCHA